jgi:two-component system OmpR family response regulator
MKILVVEDDEETRKYLASGLATEGFAVDCAANGRDALFLASGSPYDLIVVDRMLPGMDGLSLVKVLRGASVSVPVLFLTALDGIDERVAGLMPAATIIWSSRSPSPSSPPACAPCFAARP